MTALIQCARRLLALAGMAAVVACFDPGLQDGAVRCGTAGCPPGMACAADGWCRAPDPTAGADASTPATLQLDGGQVDGGQIDGGVIGTADAGIASDATQVDATSGASRR